MLYRCKDGSYVASTADGEFAKRYNKKEGDALFRKYLHKGLGPDKGELWVLNILAENREGFVVT